MTITTSSPISQHTHPKHLAKVLRTIRKRSFATLATTSARGNPHVAGVVYDTHDGSLWIHTERTSRKARNIDANPSIAVCIPLRRLPVGPPYTLHFQAHAELVEMDAPIARSLVEAGELGRISGHGALEMPDGVFIRLNPTGRVHSYGLGENPIDLARDPLGVGARTVDVSDRGLG